MTAGYEPATDNCPRVANPDQSNHYGDARGDACEPRVAPKIKLTAKRGKGALWKLRIHASGHGQGVVSVRCRQRRGAQVRTVYTRTTKLPRTLRRSVRCGASRPKARLAMKTPV